MADIWDPGMRSRVMARIRGKNTKPELIVRRYLHAQGFRFRIHVKDLPGSPDIVLPAYKAIVLVHGCFWHGHTGCRDHRIPASNAAFWEAKITRNQARDTQQAEALSRLGWQLFTVWECELRGAEGRARLARLTRQLTDLLPDFKPAPTRPDDLDV